MVTPQTETPIYKKGRVTVTTARFMVDQQTYAVRNITSVRPEEIEPGRGGTILSICFGIFLVIVGRGGGTEGSGLMMFGGIVAGIALLVLLMQRSTFAVTLTTAGGEVKAITSKSEKTIIEIVNALNQAIIDRA